MNRRSLIKSATATSLLALLQRRPSSAQPAPTPIPPKPNGLPALKITKVRPILTTPMGGGVRLIVDVDGTGSAGAMDQADVLRPVAQPPHRPVFGIYQLAGVVPARVVWALFAVLHDDIIGLYPSGDHVILEVSVYSKLAKEYKGNPPGHEKTKNELFIYKFRDGKICESRSYV